jgi:anti-sigma B factor antagonist
MPSPEPFLPPPRGLDSLAPGSFGCALHHSGRDAAWLTLGGELDLAAASQLAPRLEEALAGARLVIVDLRGLTLMDSAGLAAIVTAHRRARRSGRRLVLVRGPEQVDRLLQITAVPDQLEITALPQIHR